MDGFRRIQLIITMAAFFSLVLVAPTGSMSKEQFVGAEIQLPAVDRTFLEQILGKNVVGNPVVGAPISDPLDYFPLEEGTWVYRVTNGKNKGKSVQQVLTRLIRDKPGTSWREAAGKNSLLYLLKTASGGVEIVSTEDQAQGVISRYLPREPITLPGMNPGDTKLMKTDVKVYDLSHPDHLAHKGFMNITYSYVGAYEVKVPAGTFKASLFKWQYNGKVGPATVEDIQYRFFAKGVGTVAMVEKTDVTALLVYREHTKIGKVLIKKE
ncbi:MAG: hypothetical protein LJE88_10310 [Deltaproteobacteria bacterium]|nr:hypothetical protein [Deltaproteobacteria bacterium]